LEQEALHMRSVRQLVGLVDPRPPRRGLLAGHRVRAYLGGLLGDDLSFSDLRLPLALKAVDLNCGRQVCLRQGAVLDAVLATAAFPGVFAPVEIDGATLVDGGVLDNLPVEMPREMGADVVIAVNVSPPLDEMEAPPELSILPGPAKEMYQVAMIMNTAMTGIHLKAAPPDVLISPDLPKGIGIFSGFTKADQIIAAGEAAARRSLPQLRRLLAH
jgi:NTE family protein